VDGIPDPQLHAHCFVFNTTFDQEEERWKAGQFRELKRDAPYFQAAFRQDWRTGSRTSASGWNVKGMILKIAGISSDVLKRVLTSNRRDREAGRDAEVSPIRIEKAELGAESRENKGKLSVGTCSVGNGTPA